MSPVLPFEIIILIINVVGENKQTDLLKELALVSHSFLQICRKHLFATIALDDTRLSSKRNVVKVLKSRPEVVKYIRKLTYNFGNNNFVDGDRLLLSILTNFLRSIHHLNYLAMTSSWSTELDWKKLDSSLTSALLHFMHLPTINRIDLSSIENFPLSGLIPCVNLLRLDMFYLNHAHEDDDDFEIIPSEVMPKLCEFRTTRFAVLTRKLLYAKMQDGRPAFNPINLRRLSLYYSEDFEGKSMFRYLLQNAKLLEELRLEDGLKGSIVGLHDILSPTACTLKILHLTSSFLFPIFDVSTPARQFCEELEAMAGHNVLEALSFAINMCSSEETENDADDFVGTIIQNVGEIVVKTGWSDLRQVSFKVVRHARKGRAKLKALQSLTDKCLDHISKLESVQVTFSCEVRIF